MTTEVVEKVDYTGKSVYYPTRNTTHTTTTYKINGVTYQEEINLKQGEGEFLTTNYISKQNGDGSTTIIDSTSSEFLDIALDTDRTSALTKTYNEVEEQSKTFGKYDKFLNASAESGMDVVMETGNFNTVVPNRVTQDQLLALQGATTLESTDRSSEFSNDPAELRKNPFMSLKGMNMQYPKDALYSSGQDYLFIEGFEYGPPQARDLRATGGKSNSFLGAAREQSGNVAVTGLSRQSNIRKSQGSVKLPIPNGLNVSNGVGWGEGRANAVEAGAFFQAFGSAQDLITGEKNVAQIITENFQAAGGLLDALKADAGKPGGGQASMVLSAVLAKAGLAKMNINVDPAQFITRSTGNAINPNLELLFSGPKLRNFTFSFMFAPHDDDEASEVRKIIRWFKQGMAPKNDIDSESTIYLGSPNVYRLKYMNRGRRIKGLNIFKICALTGCELDFAPSKTYQSYEDGTAVSMPPMIGMALSFTELTPIFSNDYEDLPRGLIADGNVSTGDLGLLGNDSISPDDIGF